MDIAFWLWDMYMQIAPVIIGLIYVMPTANTDKSSAKIISFIQVYILDTVGIPAYSVAF